MLAMLTRGWLKAAAVATLVVLAVWMFGGLTGGLMRELAQSRAWIKQPDFTEASKESEDLFRELVRDRIIWLDPAAPALRNQPCEAIFEPSLAIQPAAASGGHSAPQTFRRKQLERMCNQPAGRQILDEILVWNSSFLIAAIRDDRAGGTRCADGSQLDLPVVPPGCRPAPWSATILQAGGFSSPLTPIPGAVPPPRDFADFAAGRVRTLSDWAMFGPLRDGEDRLSLASRLPAGNRRVLAELILNPTRITVGGQSAAIDGKRESLRVSLAGLSIGFERVCDEDDFENCAEAAAKGLPQGWRLTIDGRRARDIDIAIEGTPVRAVPPSAREILTGEGGTTGKVRLWRSAQIEANCERQRAGLDCALSWRTSVTQQRRGGGARRVAFADGSPAIDAAGKPVPDVDEMGLTALIGYGPSDVGSLTSAVGNARTREPLVLTIEPQLQKLAQEAVYEKMGARLERGARRKRIVAGTPEDREPPDQGEGRAAVVLMDAGDAPGEILAVAGWPEFRPGLHSWDVLALSSGREGDSPLAGHPWRAGDVHAMPGSTFKLVTGLAGIAASKTVPWAGDVVTGREPPARQMARLGIGAGAIVVDGLTISNYGGGAFAGAVLPPGPGASGCPVANPGSQVGVCEALIKSSNLWFAGLALGLDGGKTTSRPPERPSGRTGTFLAAAAERLFPISQPPGSPLPQGYNARGVDMTRGIVPGALRLYAEPIDLAVEDKRNARRIDLATNSYGQGVRATPMAMATIYGSVGARRVIAPRILKPVGDVAETKTPFEGERIIAGMDASEDARWLAVVDAGLHGVSNSPYGTAVGAMSVVPPEIRTRVYGKTGTADTSPGMNSAWFAGWINDAAGRRRIAFACWVTHTQLSGGKACGQLMAPLLAKIGAMKGRT